MAATETAKGESSTSACAVGGGRRRGGVRCGCGGCGGNRRRRGDCRRHVDGGGGRHICCETGGCGDGQRCGGHSVSDQRVGKQGRRAEQTRKHDRLPRGQARSGRRRCLQRRGRSRRRWRSGSRRLRWRRGRQGRFRRQNDHGEPANRRQRRRKNHPRRTRVGGRSGPRHRRIVTGIINAARGTEWCSSPGRGLRKGTDGQR